MALPRISSIAALAILTIARPAFVRADLAPKSMESDPTLEMSAITELTAEGKRLPPVSPQHPVYYVADSAGAHQVGDPLPGEVTLTEQEMGKLLAGGLAQNGYLPADAAHPPTLLVVYSWGSHRQFSNASQTEQLKTMLEQATMVGGQQFAYHLYQLVREAQDNQYLKMNHSPAQMPGTDRQPRISYSRGDIGSVMGPDSMNAIDPLENYRNSGPDHAFLLGQSTDPIYYIVATAYDYSYAAQRKSLVYWRTHLTVNATGGVNQPQSLPTLMLAGAPYFGKDMDAAAVMRQRSTAHVEVGDTQVIGTMPAPAPGVPAVPPPPAPPPTSIQP